MEKSSHVWEQLNFMFHGVKVSERERFYSDVRAWLQSHSEPAHRGDNDLVCGYCVRGLHVDCTEETEPENRFEHVLNGCSCPCPKKWERVDGAQKRDEFLAQMQREARERQHERREES